MLYINWLTPFLTWHCNLDGITLTHYQESCLSNALRDTMFQRHQNFVMQTLHMWLEDSAASKYWKGWDNPWLWCLQDVWHLTFQNNFNGTIRHWLVHATIHLNFFEKLCFFYTNLFHFNNHVDFITEVYKKHGKNLKENDHSCQKNLVGYVIDILPTCLNVDQML